MYQTIHSVVVRGPKGAGIEIAPGNPIEVDAKEAEILLRIGAIKAIESKPAEVAADKAPAAKKPSKKELADKAAKETAEAAAAEQAAKDAADLAQREADEAAAAAQDIDNFGDGGGE